MKTTENLETLLDWRKDRQGWWSPAEGIIIPQNCLLPTSTDVLPNMLLFLLHWSVTQVTNDLLHERL